MQSGGRATVDVAVTEVHGLQGDLSFQDTAQGTIGRLTAHAYMDPVEGQKYGLFASMSDLDGRSLSWFDLGAEGQLNISDSAVIGVRAGLGRADDDSLDYIFGGVSLAYALSPSFEVELALDAVDFDESDFRATSVESALTAKYAPAGQPWGLYASATYSDLTGRDGADAELRIGAGLSISFGTSGGSSANTRHFRDHDTVAPLVRRGLR